MAYFGAYLKKKSRYVRLFDTLKQSDIFWVYNFQNFATKMSRKKIMMIKKTFKLVTGSIMIDGYYIQYFRTNDSDPDPYSVAL